MAGSKSKSSAKKAPTKKGGAKSSGENSFEAAGEMKPAPIAKKASATKIKREPGVLSPLRLTSTMASGAKAAAPAIVSLADLGLASPTATNSKDGYLVVAVLEMPGNRCLLLFRCVQDDPNSRQFHGEKVSIVNLDLVPHSPNCF
jgi:hypothetical protein